ncbi:DUF1080 domain-containing protein [Candidatus Poribacteria bacterium]|nr:DUF1080 domain-containing protein [Candidatus Poribacteria bacterium]
MAGSPPSGAVVLFDGSDLNGWTTRSGGAPGWQVSHGIMTVVPKSGDIMSRYTFRDSLLHLEFRCPDMPEARGQAKGNSGVFLQGRYEIQVLDSYGIPVPGKGDCAAIYDQFAPLTNACKPPMEWQSYDACFRAARVDGDGKTITPARITLLHNGVVVHNNVQTNGPTGGSVDLNVGEPGPLLLQDHGNLVSYRNVWVLPLAEEGSSAY